MRPATRVGPGKVARARAHSSASRSACSLYRQPVCQHHAWPHRSHRSVHHGRHRASPSSSHSSPPGRASRASPTASNRRLTLSTLHRTSKTSTATSTARASCGRCAPLLPLLLPLRLAVLPVDSGLARSTARTRSRRLWRPDHRPCVVLPIAQARVTSLTLLPHSVLATCRSGMGGGAVGAAGRAQHREGLALSTRAHRLARPGQPVQPQGRPR